MHIPNSQHRFKCYYVYVVMYTFTHIESFTFMNFTLQILEFKYLLIPSYQYNNSSKPKRKRFKMKCSTNYKYGIGEACHTQLKVEQDGKTAKCTRWLKELMDPVIRVIHMKEFLYLARWHNVVVPITCLEKHVGEQTV